MSRYPNVPGGCRINACPWMARRCRNRWHRLLNRLTLTKEPRARA